MAIPGLEFVVAKRPAAEDLRQPDQPTQGAPSPAVSGVAEAEDEAGASLEATPEQLRYAGVLEKGAQLGLLCLFVTFPLYVFGIVKPHTPLDQVSQFCTLDVHEYHSRTGVELGWGWARMLGRADYLNFVGMVILAGVTAVCCLAIVPLMFKRKDTIYAVMALLQVVILALAASGVLVVGH